MAADAEMFLGVSAGVWCDLGTSDASTETIKINPPKWYFGICKRGIVAHLWE